MTDILQQSLAHTDVPALAMPVGGIGTGGFAINADASLRQWQLHSVPNHRGALPGTGFWLRLTQIEPPLDVVSMVQAHPVDDPKAPLTTDAHVPSWMTDAGNHVSFFESAQFSGTYPIAEVSLSDSRHPLQITMRALNPMVPGDVDVSGVPTGMFEFTLHNTSDIAVHGTLAGSLLNAVGWDGITPISSSTPGLGGNVNRLRRAHGWSQVVMDNPTLDESHPLAGQMVISADDPRAAVLTRCSGIEHLTAFLESRALNNGVPRLDIAPTVGDPQLNAPSSGQGPSPQGQSWLGVVGVPFWIEPGESRSIRFSFAWHFPNRMVDIEQFGGSRPEWGSTKFYLGNAYALRFADAVAVSDAVAAQWSDLVRRTSRWTTNLVSSSLSPDETDRLAAQAAYVRSPTCFIGADGRFYGYEGSLGASTTMWSGQFGGSCPMNCTHVWQYEAALAGLWPQLERNMRDTELEVMQNPDGSIPHRLRVPAYLPQMGYGIGGPEEPALDGMLATIVKSLRDVQRGAGLPWLEQHWPALLKLYHHIAQRWDADGDGVLRGIQPSTHDIDLAGVNSFMGSLWLAALRALEEMARLVGDADTADEARDRFLRGSVAYDELLFDGTHYVQKLDEGDPTDYQWMTGVLSDQVIGQWWAHQLGLGYILPKEHVRSALRHVVAMNLRHGFDTFEHPYRVYADAADDSGLLMCSWPEGGRPAVPTRYADEVWTGIEWQVAAHCLFEGLIDEGEAILHAMWKRHDGRRRNPYNEIECGDHYARAMAGWTTLQALSGVRVDHAAGVIVVDKPGRWPWVGARGYGWVDVSDDGIRMHAVEGVADLAPVRMTARE
ncbi:GH116 family glycosyl-hydrolase [Microbacterium sp. YY-01]|uniref:GH116 family glycosyl-hydrolase n=1 Tax=Microbacterium sp. YY-01 TaxID=3421634 RepID=UPI003D177F8B